jgi:hypothetical protein
MRKSKERWGVASACLCAIASVLAGCDNNNHPDHYYKAVNSGTYTYEAASNAIDTSDSDTPTTTVTMRYEGNTNGTYTFMVFGSGDADGLATRMSCQDPCQSASVTAFINGVPIDASMLAEPSGMPASSVTLSGIIARDIISSGKMDIASDSAMHNMFEDAKAGKLVPYKAPPANTPATPPPSGTIPASAADAAAMAKP